MQRDIKNLVRLLFLAVAILIMKTASANDTAHHGNSAGKAAGGLHAAAPSTAGLTSKENY